VDLGEDWVYGWAWRLGDCVELVRDCVEDGANKKELLVKLDMYFIKDMQKILEILEIWSIFWKIFLNKHHKKIRNLKEY
jgi:hypothetical protein